MRRQVELFFCAVQFLTRLPTPALSRFEPDWTTRSARWFPLVGQLVGGLSALVLLGAAHFWNSWIAALLAVGAGVLITGAFHEDGLADTADGLGGGQTPKRRLEIMKDSRVGTFGVIALVLVLGLKIAALASLAPAAAAVALLAAHGAGRGAAVLTMRLSPYAGDALAAKWKPVPDGVRWGEVVLALAIAVWPLFLLPTLNVALGLVIGGALVLIVVLLARRLIGGHTGDILGAVEQVFELGFLLGLAAAL
ncbi:adenosylcobinamide-GDP ribazoletransferase [Caulobacter segnis]|uniref:adenosylcobinamide-GDP ribazoletransferase n=1 Tax=Caulobacter segnis TaxID=88688 RepID=UPI00240F461A|nr:adenosylcobinamide-GDP ribazoletransferase [Caulobacter segnis]MDG2521850.1 adenosylcobinamide-GDP ribazoletransferase [Caulobacter segnis]